ncbi:MULTISPECIES: Ycf34 family protein [Prochlorococcus]|uniref:Putative Ycf34 n=1 Tax=Prochlorococcus marinus str. MIT 9116 TaxID=167544 RepID=A0A0A1ZVJ5_PROMR|nr:Ycf34 family protein [Prochlorococcus marinus]KGF89842.1 putative Ycf34 [Prochlorococcus marinus str. MIT 9107]KGF92309.1 putative Ycf34 [Prochlorococcus marinus str. MIT 9116]KGF92626.1 putative Ycf34 [Prochlorococcus marinus str. MIT 9123]
MCIFVNCKWVERCSTYHDIEKNHEVEHLTSFPDVNAKNPFIHVSLVEEKNENFSIEWDVKYCSSFYEEIGRWSKIKPGLKVHA